MKLERILNIQPVQRPHLYLREAKSQDISCEWERSVVLSMDWFKGNFTGNPHIYWENLWFPVDFPLNQSIDFGVYFPKNGYFFCGTTLATPKASRLMVPIFESLQDGHWNDGIGSGGIMVTKQDHHGSSA